MWWFYKNKMQAPKADKQRDCCFCKSFGKTYFGRAAKTCGHCVHDHEEAKGANE